MNIRLNDIEEMVFIGTVPRSGSSMNSGILDISGAFFGEVIPANKNNPKGMFENTTALKFVFNPILKSLGVRGPRELWDVVNSKGIDPKYAQEIKESMTYVMNRQGYEGGVCAFKHASYLFLYDAIKLAFPDATWILPCRKEEDCKASNMVTGKKRGKKEVDDRFEFIRRMYQYIKDDCGERAFLMDNDALVGGDLSQIRCAVDSISGLKWNEEKVKDFVDPSLWGTFKTEKNKRRGKVVPNIKRGGNNRSIDK